MITKEAKWPRWAGQSNDLLNAADLAVEVLATWSGYESEVSVSTALKTV